MSGLLRSRDVQTGEEQLKRGVVEAELGTPLNKREKKIKYSGSISGIHSISILEDMCGPTRVLQF